MARERLTPRQQRFVSEYLIDLNATAAYRRAGYKAATDNVAAVEGHRLLRNPKVAAAVQEARRTMTEKAGLTVEYVLARLREEAERDDDRSSHSARVRALELLGKYLGMWQELPTVDEIAAAIIERERQALAEGPGPS